MTEINLPDGWLDASLDDVLLSIVGGGTPSKSNVSYFEGSIPWMSVKDMNKNTLEDTVDHITQEAVENSSTNVIPAGTPIVATRMSLGKIVVANFDSAINQDLKALFHATGIERDYLVNWYRANSKLIESLGTGTTVKGIRLEVLRALKFPLPPLAEQKVIADKLDKLLSQVETTKTRLDRIPKILKTFRQSVLAAAVSGKLTEEWRNQDQSEWPITKCKLGDLIELAYGKSLPAKARSGDGYSVYGSNGAVGLHKEFLVEAPFIIVGRKGSYGEVTWSDDNGWPIDTTYFVNLRQKSDLKFVYFLLQTLGLNQLNRSTAIPGLNREDAYGKEIFIPKVKEQTQIVSRVEELFAFSDIIEQKANASLEHVNNLTQSILAKAFRGELTADWRAANPGLITGENGAEALLAKIKAEREALSSKKKPKKKAVTRKKV